MIKRSQLLDTVKNALNRSRVVALIGPRQCGKTTIARNFVDADSINYFDLEDPVSLTRLNEPMTALKDLRQVVVIDEIQRRPDLFPVLRVLADRKPLPARFLILGSASPDLLRQSSESLAGRIETLEMKGFTFSELGIQKQQLHWSRGGFPLSFLARSDERSLQWRKSFIQTVSERDLPLLGYRIPSTTVLRFWAMLAHYHGQIWNAAEPARSLGISETSVRRYLDLLTDIFMIRQLQPWHANLKKRQVKSPKIYFRDTGILHQLLGIRSHKDLLQNPKCGASWEGYAIEEIMQIVKPNESYFWATHNGAEIDLVLVKNGKMFGVECKRSDSPSITSSMRIALSDLSLEQILVIYPGDKSFMLSDNIRAIALQNIISDCTRIFKLKSNGRKRE
ncbi:MAG: ATP-binding protein [Chitinispirillaceae bacterium]|nr:ATP-binding protein [Chitinispirillaceae bacterium]